MSVIKDIIRFILRLLLTPFRFFNKRRNGVVASEARHELPNDVFLGLVSEKLAEGHTAVIWVKGYSMRPFIEFGRDKVKLASAATYQVGDAVLAEIEKGHYVLHRIIEKTGEKLILQGDGNVRGVEHCTVADVRGVVTEYIRPNRILSADDPCLKRKIRIWRTLRPIRRYLLAMYKETLSPLPL
jgi:hypothetical protein